MGLLWWKNKQQTQTPQQNTQQPQNAKLDNKQGVPVPGMNGAVEVPRRRPETEDVTVFEFGSVANVVDKVTLAGHCPVSEELEPCRWEIVPANDNDAPQFRVVF